MVQIITQQGGGGGGGGGGTGDGDMKKAVYDPQNIGKDAFNYENFTNTPTIPTEVSELDNDAGYITSAALNGYQTTSNLVTNLTNPDDTHYPSAKAVSDAITSAGGGDMLKSVYDPNNVNADAFDYDNFINTPTIPTKTSELSNDSGFITGITSSDVTAALGYTPYNSTNPSGYVTTSIINNTAYGSSRNGDTTHAPTKDAVYDKMSSIDNAIGTNTTAISTINGKIPSSATSSNQLADKNYVDDSINSVTAYYITKNAAGDQWANRAELFAATTFYSGGVVRVPTKNDYTIVLSDEQHDNATTRYIYNNGWEYQYTVNETAMTQAQLNALNSGITSSKVATYDGYASTIAGKQDTLVSGTNIKTINNQSILGDGNIDTDYSTVKQFAYPSVGSDITDLHNWLYTSGVSTKKGAILSSGTGANESNYYEVVYFIYAMGEGTINAERSTNTGIEYVTIDYSLSGGVATVDSITSTNTGVTSVNGQTGAVTVEEGDSKVFAISDLTSAASLATATQAYEYAYTNGKSAIIRYNNNNYVYVYGATTLAYFSRAYGKGAVSSGGWEEMSTLKLTVSSGSVTAIAQSTNLIAISSSAPSSSTGNGTITLVI